MAKFYVYIHRRADNNQPFYVGKGVGDRDAQTEKRSSHWKRVFNKYGRTIERVSEFDNEADAFALEIALIDFIGRVDLCTGSLVNKTDGGEGASNPSDETRQKRTKTSHNTWGTPEMREKKSTVFKKIWAENRERIVAAMNSDEAKAKSSESAKARWADPEKRKQLLAARAKTNDVRIAKIKAAKATPEYRKKCSDLLKSKWQDQEKRQEMIHAMNTPDGKRNRSIASKQRKPRKDFPQLSLLFNEGV